MADMDGMCAEDGSQCVETESRWDLEDSYGHLRDFLAISGPTGTILEGLV
jgi:hypothetical protein